MEKEKTKHSAKGKEYTIQMLLNDIQNSLNEDNEENTENEKRKREIKHKLVVMQMLLALAFSFRDEQYADDEKLYSALDVKVNNDELLSGYMFFISQNPQFEYTWSYMRKRRSSFKEYLANAVRFINNVVADINVLASIAKEGNDWHVLFNDFFDVSLTPEEPNVKTSVIWENFHLIVSMKRSYYVSIKYNECILLVGDRKKETDTEALIDKALKMIRETKRDSR